MTKEHDDLVAIALSADDITKLGKGEPVSLKALGPYFPGVDRVYLVKEEANLEQIGINTIEHDEKTKADLSKSLVIPKFEKVTKFECNLEPALVAAAGLGYMRAVTWLRLAALYLQHTGQTENFLNSVTNEALQQHRERDHQ